MTGDRVPGTHERAIAYMMYNMVYGKHRRKMKRWASKERRRWNKMLLRDELEAK